MSAMTDARRGRGGGLYAQVVDGLGQDIVNGVLKEGELIWVEQLGGRFGVSRSVMRESLRTLGSMGLLEARPRVGTRVLPRSRWDLLNPMVVYWRGRGNDAIAQQRELLEMRLGVEPIAARLAATRMSTAAASEALDHAVAMLAAADSNDQLAFFGADATLHRIIFEASGNALLAQLADTVAAVLLARRTDRRPDTSVMRAASAREHIGLAQALVQRNPDKAEAIVRGIVETTLSEFQAQEAGGAGPAAASGAPA